MYNHLTTYIFIHNCIYKINEEESSYMECKQRSGEGGSPVQEMWWTALWRCQFECSIHLYTFWPDSYRYKA